jgi:Zn finger protein HypA/HybF involved in hydrogenase expression
MIGKGLKVKVKCPFCGTTSCNIMHESKRFEWHVYECYKCKEKFRVRKGWRQRVKRA